MIIMIVDDHYDNRGNRDCRDNHHSHHLLKLARWPGYILMIAQFNKIEMI